MSKLPEADVLTPLLEARLGAPHVARRLQIEAAKEAPRSSAAANVWRTIRRDTGRFVLGKLLRFTRTRDRGRANLLRVGCNHNRLPIAGLPVSFDGFRILHISDPHLDIHDDLAGAIVDRMASVSSDLCVLTGDFRARTFGSIDRAMQGLRQLRSAISTDVYAVLGNHDSLRMVPPIEAMGIRLLLNEAVSIERGGARLALVGVDDPHYYRTADLPRATRDVAPDETRILLAHSPELFDEAARMGFQAYLCGHTHGGQICLPGGYPIWKNARAPRAYCGGRWQHGQMHGYTSRGSGASIVAARFNCPPEITLHTLTVAG